MTHTDDALTEAVAKVLCGFDVDNNGGYVWEHRGDSWGSDYEDGRDYYREMAETALTAVRKFDEHAALNCGHCTPNTDEIACACQIKERDDE